MRIGEVAAHAGVNVRTLRYYERRALLDMPARATSGYRDYRPDVVRRVRFIRRAKELGFTLREVAELLTLRDLPSPRAARASGPDDARTLAVAKIADLDRRIRHLSAMREALRTLAESCACDHGAPTCAILEAIEEPHDESGEAAPAGRPDRPARPSSSARKRRRPAPSP
jgi:DNA-binding transcriptional MerR regulator